MGLPFVSMFITSPFDGLEEHAKKVKQCIGAFQEAFACNLSAQCTDFEEHRRCVRHLENEADAIKRRIRGHLPRGTLLPVDKFELFRYLRQQDKVIDAVQHALDWLSYRDEQGIPPALQTDFQRLVKTVVQPIDELDHLVIEARYYFKAFQEEQRVKVKQIIRQIRQMEHDADQVEDALKRRVFNMDLDAVTIFHMTRLAEIIGSIADHAENAGDMMRAMVAK
jgi:predicted phosphate transport protein (TIGR00153 family)